MADFEIEPIGTKVTGVVVVVPVAIDRVANVERVLATVHENGGDSVTVFTIPKIIIGILVIDFE